VDKAIFTRVTIYCAKGGIMAIKVVVVDAAELPESVEFPPLKTEKYSWEQYPRPQQRGDRRSMLADGFFNIAGFHH
jgi:hypothetical protein